LLVRAVALRADPALPEVSEALAPLVPCLARGLSLARQTGLFPGDVDAPGAAAATSPGVDEELLLNVMSAMSAISTILDVSVTVAKNSAVVQALLLLIEDYNGSEESAKSASAGTMIDERRRSDKHVAAATEQKVAVSAAAEEDGSDLESESEDTTEQGECGVERLVAGMEKLALAHSVGESVRSEALDVLLSCAATSEGMASLVKERVFERVAARMLAQPDNLAIVDPGCQLFNAWLDMVMSSCESCTLSYEMCLQYFVRLM